MNKSVNAPRKIYTRGDKVLVAFAGRIYASTAKGSKLDPEKLAKCEKLKSDGGKSRISVSQGDVTETFRALPK